MRALIITQCPARGHRALRRLAAAADLVLAADGGARVARLAGVVPHEIVGDLDSLDAATRRWARQRRIRRRVFPRAKEATDAELALRQARRRGARLVWLFGAVSGRLDQTLANVLLLFAARRLQVVARLTDGRAVACLVDGVVEVQGRQGDAVSLLPLSPVVRGITTVGLRYRLRRGVLHRGSTRGLSNEMTASAAAVRLTAGDLLLVHTPR
ncbi:MAG: thiamine diphosphokinase [Armatimonadota bacterium]|nr:thiamine diphosphokinase [Armatimonadota bacterium]MDR7427101.1 thiamine diphosphokinase [Armatimonadota bacterium]MDR7465487.1 thiamine diphosphokinase [Armatimonadota bacterium]MDR7470029.1 thiamine diphosphokinase [Armatimonadota bacterium]MDR7474131.1 thiamine diphosphokinase [Armatimonadota bacterium]